MKPRRMKIKLPPKLVRALVQNQDQRVVRALVQNQDQRVVHQKDETNKAGLDQDHVLDLDPFPVQERKH
jgi:hypothetical protein